MALMVGLSLSEGWTLAEAIRGIDWLVLLIGGLILVAVMFTLCPLAIFWRLKRRGFLGPNRLELADNGVKTAGPAAESLVYWSAIQKITQTGRHLFMFIAPGSALMVPRRAFASDGDFRAFVSAAEQRWKASKPA
jgi:hypothetical protein